MDGLPAMKLALETGQVQGIKPIVKMVGPLAPKNGTITHVVYSQGQLSSMILLSFLVGTLAALYGMPLWTGLKGHLIDVPRHIDDMRLAHSF